MECESENDKKTGESARLLMLQHNSPLNDALISRMEHEFAQRHRKHETVIALLDLIIPKSVCCIQEQGLLSAVRELNTSPEFVALLVTNDQPPH